MGNSQKRITNETKEALNNRPEYIQLSKITYQEKLYMYTEQIFLNDKQYQNIINLCKTLQQNPLDFLVPIEHFNAITQNEMICTSHYIIEIYLQKMDLTFQDYIQYLKEKQHYFKENELWYAMKQCLKYLVFSLGQPQTLHRDVFISFINIKGELRFINSAFLESPQEILTLSDDLLEFLQIDHISIQQRNTPILEMALMLLNMASLKTQYKYVGYCLNKAEFKISMDKIKIHYSIRFYNMLYSLFKHNKQSSQDILSQLTTHLKDQVSIASSFDIQKHIEFGNSQNGLWNGERSGYEYKQSIEIFDKKLNELCENQTKTEIQDKNKLSPDKIDYVQQISIDTTRPQQAREKKTSIGIAPLQQKRKSHSKISTDFIKRKSSKDDSPGLNIQFLSRIDQILQEAQQIEDPNYVKQYEKLKDVKNFSQISMGELMKKDTSKRNPQHSKQDYQNGSQFINNKTPSQVLKKSSQDFLVQKSQDHKFSPDQIYLQKSRISQQSGELYNPFFVNSQNDVQKHIAISLLDIQNENYANENSQNSQIIDIQSQNKQLQQIEEKPEIHQIQEKREFLTFRVQSPENSNQTLKIDSRYQKTEDEFSFQQNANSHKTQLKEKAQAFLKNLQKIEDSMSRNTKVF